VYSPPRAEIRRVGRGDGDLAVVQPVLSRGRAQADPVDRALDKQGRRIRQALDREFPAGVLAAPGLFRGLRGTTRNGIQPG